MSRARSRAEDGFEQLIADSIREFSRTEPDDGLLHALIDQVRFVRGSFDDAATFERLAAELAELDQQSGRSPSTGSFTFRPRRRAFR